MIDLIRRTAQIMRSPIVLFCGGSAFAILSLAGPFGTFTALELPLRATYWAIVVVTWAFALTVVSALQEKYLPELPLARSAFVVAGALTIAYTPFLYALGHLMTGHLRQVTPLLTVGLFVFFVNFLVVQMRHYWDAASMRAPKEASPILGHIRPCDVVHATVDDHYVRLSTRRGEKRLLMRFADALHELRDSSGLQVHRSHWVAESAIRRIARKDGRITIFLEDGRPVPVSRGFQSDVLGRFRNLVE